MNIRRLPLLIALGLLAASCGQPEAPATADDPPDEGATDGEAATGEGATAATPAVVYARLPSSAPTLQQMPVLPQPSPKAAVEQTVGIATIRVDYSSPAVRGRTVWGELVPHGQLWRAGANAATRIEISEPATIFGTEVPAGAYSIFMIPGEGDWTVIFNRDSQNRGYQGHDEREDVARGTVTPAQAPARERMTFLFEDTTETSTKLVLDWAGKRVVVPIEFATPALAQARIDATLQNAWRPHFNAGRYFLEQEGQEQRAVELLTKSQQIQSTWWNEWFLARALAAVNRKAEARTHAERAQQLGANDEIFTQNFAAQVRTALEEWR